MNANFPSNFPTNWPRRLIIQCIRGTTHGVCRAGENMTTSGSSDSLLLLLVGGDRLAALVRVIIFSASSSSWGAPAWIRQRRSFR